MSPKHASYSFNTPSPYPAVLGIDYIDVSGASRDAGREVTMEPAHFELSPNQLEWVE